ncbi:MAG: hypothetical protein K2N70_02545, partial [Helicobacter sp.]|nr:hypothetical protein [Helicobacter sp.]
AFPLSPFDPQSLARFLKVCAPHGLCLYSTALRLCYAFGSNIDVARCGWEIGIGEQWQRDVSLTLNMTRFHCHCERAARAWQSTSSESQKESQHGGLLRATPSQ